MENTKQINPAANSSHEQSSCDSVSTTSLGKTETENNPYKDFTQFRRKRFLFAAGHFDYYSGAEKQAVFFARELIQNLEANVTFLGWGGNGRFADEIRAIGAKPVLYPLSPAPNNWIARYRWLRLAAFIKKEIHPDFILPYVWMHCRILGAIWKSTGAKFCWWNQRDEGRGLRGTRLERKLLRSLPAVVSNSWEGRDFLVHRFQLSTERVSVVNNGIELPTLQKDPSWKLHLGIPANSKLIAMVANLTRFKDHATLLKSFAETRQLCPEHDVHLALIGSLAEETERLKALAWDLDLGRSLHFTGSVNSVEQALRSVDMVVHSSITEGCPNGALEAMALGLPVLGTDISGMRQALGEMQSDKCLSSPGNWKELAEKIAQRLRSPEHCITEGQHNRKRIEEHFSITKMATESLQIISERI
jgi:glycosyltransferase involved in cell wall biosynthesis